MWLHKIMDFGANVTLTGGLCLQSKESWSEFIDNQNITFKSNIFEVYFEACGFEKSYNASPMFITSLWM